MRGAQAAAASKCYVQDAVETSRETQSRSSWEVSGSQSRRYWRRASGSAAWFAARRGVGAWGGGRGARMHAAQLMRMATLSPACFDGGRRLQSVRLCATLLPAALPRIAGCVVPEPDSPLLLCGRAAAPQMKQRQLPVVRAPAQDGSSPASAPLHHALTGLRRRNVSPTQTKASIASLPPQCAPRPRGCGCARR